jgi:hypothetical protein
VNRKWLWSTAAFLAFDLGVGEIGEPIAQRMGFDPADLSLVTVLVCIGAGYAARRLGGPAFVAGGVITGLEAFGWVVTGGMAKDGPSPPFRPLYGIWIVCFGLAWGAMLGAIGGWIANRRQQADVTKPASPD